MRNSSIENQSKLMQFRNRLIDKDFLEKSCATCGKQFSYNIKWNHVPNFCTSCIARYEKEKVKAHCIKCGALFSCHPSKGKWDYCYTCFHAIMVRKRCRRCGVSIYVNSELINPVVACSKCKKEYDSSHPQKPLYYIEPKDSVCFGSH